MLKISQENFPPAPGVYIFRDQNQKVIYVGKAKNLKKRIASYFRNQENLAPDKKLMLARAKSLEHIVVDNESEALLLENNLIKKYRPRYNIVFKDDKSYVYIKITAEKFPRVFIERENRKTKKEEGILFGPYPASDEARTTLKILRKIFPYRSCRILPHRICLFSHLKLCPAPCENKIEPEAYQKIISEIISFLRGHHLPIIRETKRKMREESVKQNFETAAILRDRISALEKIQEKQKVVSRNLKSQDVISITRSKKMAVVNLFRIREGRLIGKENFILLHTIKKTDNEILQRFLGEYYFRKENQPQEIVLPATVEKTPLLTAELTVPQKGQKRKLIKMGEKNAREYLKTRIKIERTQKIKIEKALIELASYLRLKKPPQRIEAYDISNIQGQEATGSMIVFKNGAKNPSSYRRFKIKTINSPNDVAMMREILARRLKRINQKDSWPLPDLILVDGGKPQLNAALQVFKKYQIAIPLCALAKKLEQIYIPHQKKPINIPLASAGLMLLKRIRDEAHRFAIAYHHKLRSKNLLK
ncbi:MAG: excinuclease ABC subunit UvrC [Candidatus Doudnabacteria bacterium]